jgi:hypothetical protein
MSKRTLKTTQIDMEPANIRLREGTYCLPLWQAYNGPDSIESSSDLCSDCNIKSWQVLLKSPLHYTDRAAAKYSSLTSS